MNRHDGRWGKRKYPWKEFPKEAASFCRMQGRVADKTRKIKTSWPRTTEGFFLFLNYIGHCPKAMKQPSIGRIDHSKGYHPGNVKWQEWSENRLEGCIRGGHIAGSKGRSRIARIRMSKIAFERKENRSRAGKLGGRASQKKFPVHLRKRSLKTGRFMK